MASDEILDLEARIITAAEKFFDTGVNQRIACELYRSARTAAEEERAVKDRRVAIDRHEEARVSLMRVVREWKEARASK